MKGAERLLSFIGGILVLMSMGLKVPQTVANEIYPERPNRVADLQASRPK